MRCLPFNIEHDLFEVARIPVHSRLYLKAFESRERPENQQTKKFPV